MKKQIDIEALLAPIPGDSPSGEDLRYSQFYEDIKEARRYDDPLSQGEWKTDIKKADWDKVINVALGVLTNKTKDLQIAVWLAEALIVKEGFEGSLAGLQIINGMLQEFWDSFYPSIEDDDLEYRIAPLELMNEKISGSVQQVPITDPSKTSGYSWLNWQESRQLGYDADRRDDTARQKREEAIAEGKPTADQFDAAVTATSPGFYKTLSETLSTCLEEFHRLDGLVDEKFGQEAPRLSEFGKALEDVDQLVQKICRDKGLFVSETPEAPMEELPSGESAEEQAIEADGPIPAATSASPVAGITVTIPAGNPGALIDTHPWEQALWDEAVRMMKSLGIQKALERLMEAALSAPSVRGQNRYKLLLSKLCLQAGRADLARPMLEQLNALIEELHLDKWESPVWIADVFGTLYQCLVSGEPSDSDVSRAQELFERMCIIDITKAMTLRK